MHIVQFLFEHPWLLLVLALYLGLLLGSFLNVLIYRLPRMLFSDWANECQTFLKENEALTKDEEKINLWLPASHCPKCKTRIKLWQNIPLLSFFLQKGRCRHCHEKISWRYPLIEALSALVFILVLWTHGFNAIGLAYAVFSLGLLALFFIDLDHQLLPDNITLPLLWLGLLLSLNLSFIPSYDAILGAVGGYLSLWLVGTGYRLITGKEGMGHGDYKLLALLGAWAGWQSLPFIILFSSVIGSLFGIGLIIFKKHSLQKPIPFGPYLCLAGFLATVNPHWMQWFYQWIAP